MSVDKSLNISVFSFQIENGNFTVTLKNNGKTIEMTAVAEKLKTEHQLTDAGEVEGKEEKEEKEEKNSNEILIALIICAVVAGISLIGIISICFVWQSKRAKERVVCIIFFLETYLCFLLYFR